MAKKYEISLINFGNDIADALMDYYNINVTIVSQNGNDVIFHSNNVSDKYIRLNLHSNVALQCYYGDTSTPNIVFLTHRHNYTAGSWNITPTRCFLVLGDTYLFIYMYSNRDQFALINKMTNDTYCLYGGMASVYNTSNSTLSHVATNGESLTPIDLPNVFLSEGEYVEADVNYIINGVLLTNLDGTPAKNEFKSISNESIIFESNTFVIASLTSTLNTGISYKNCLLFRHD